MTLPNRKACFCSGTSRTLSFAHFDQPVAPGIRSGVSPVVYRFNLRDGKTYPLAQKFPVRDKDVIFVADAPAAQIYKFFTALNQVTGPIVTGLVTCHYANC